MDDETTNINDLYETCESCGADLVSSTHTLDCPDNDSSPEWDAYSVEDF